MKLVLLWLFSLIFGTFIAVGIQLLFKINDPGIASLLGMSCVLAIGTVLMEKFYFKI